MKVTVFSQEVARNEGLKKPVNIAQIKEVMKVINVLLDKQLYKIIRAK